VCVNGPYNYVGDGDVRHWVATLEAARNPGAKVVCTGHGTRSTGEVLEDQQAFFETLIEQVRSRLANRSPEEVKGQIEPIRRLSSQPRSPAAWVRPRRVDLWVPGGEGLPGADQEEAAALANAANRAGRAHAGRTACTRDEDACWETTIGVELSDDPNRGAWLPGERAVRIDTPSATPVSCRTLTNHS
jgi:hypothetical protein